MDDVFQYGELVYECDFDEDDYQDWLEDEGRQGTFEDKLEYFKENVGFEVTYYDSETYHPMHTESYYSFDELEYDIDDEAMCQQILKDCMENGEGRLEPIMFVNDDIDIENPSEVIKQATRLFPTSEYFKNDRGFILTDGTYINGIGLDHSGAVQRISNKFKSHYDFARHGYIRCGNGLEIGAMPTSEQFNVIRQVVRSYHDDEFFLDLINGGSEYGCRYNDPNPQRVIGDIYNFYKDGIKPRGDRF